MRIAGIYPQQINHDLKIQHAVSEPYGLEMILSIAKQDNHEVELFTNFEEREGQIIPISEQRLTENILNFKPDVAAFSLYTCQYPSGKRIASALRTQLPNTVTIAGNRYPTFLKETEEPFDFFALKEGEQTFREFLHELEGSKDFSKVKGLSFKQNGKVIVTEPRERNFDLDSLPDALRFPTITKQVYRGISLPASSTNPHYAVIESSRCCYNNCKFCDNAGFWGNKISFRSVDRVIDEMFSLKEKGVDIFYFMDLNFTAFPDKTRELCEAMIAKNLNASWYCMSNTGTVDEELARDKDFLKTLKQAGCHKIAWGVESTSDSALERMNKKSGEHYTKNDLNQRVLEKSMEAGLLNQGFYIIGFPWETEESIIKDAEALKRFPLHILNIGIFTPIVLSRFHKEMLSEGFTLDPNLENHNRDNLVYSHKNLSPLKVKELQEKIYSSFYSSPEYSERITKTCKIEPRFKKAFNDYFQFTGNERRI